MRTKILVCGSTGFLMANFIRYILYRSKEFEIVSVDGLAQLSDTKRIYFNKNHRFYIGDCFDERFMERLLHLERPNIIVCGDEIFEYEVLLKTALMLTQIKIPLIMVLPVTPDNDQDQMCVPIKNIVMRSGNTVVELPNRFGMRQKPQTLSAFGGNLAYMMWAYLHNDGVSVSNIDVPWVYAEDVASFLWYIIENRRTGSVRMPPLGYMSEKAMVEKIKEVTGREFEIKESSVAGNIGGLIKHYDSDKLDWVPDSKSLNSVLEKTIRWFEANRWAFKE